MKARNQVKLDALRAVKSAILIAKTAGAGIELTDADIVKIMQKQVKQRREAAEMYTRQAAPSWPRPNSHRLPPLRSTSPSSSRPRSWRPS